MDEAVFRERVIAAAGRVRERTGIDPLDVHRSMAITTDARLELLPRSVGLGLGIFAFAIGVLLSGRLTGGAPDPDFSVDATLAAIIVVMLLGVAACALFARSARERRPMNSLYEDAWARLAVEIWPAPRFRSWDGRPSTGSVYSRSEFLIALRDGAHLERFEERAPFTRMP
ncbi:MAG: hypothetical protein RI885_1761 [Actinomycetota bacterium]|jgi:hypothetical protein